ncbi:hypothetical protein BKA83DRAFT_1428685 [Pisolithus microcarpus]|nr:hypothetical protein BKA83DRAFT_1428685 [Pisolithus microcarpus]
MSTRFQYPTLISTDAAASTDQLCQIHYGVPANGFLLPSERIVEQEKMSSDDGPQSGFLLEGPWFLGYRAQIASNSFNGSIVPQGSMPFPIAGPVDGAGGDIPVANPGVSTFVNPMSLVSPTSTSDSQRPPPGFFVTAPQNPTPSQESADDRQPCGWRGDHGDTCKILVSYHCEAHLASAHGIVDMSRTRIVKCGRCGKRMGRRSILRHYREIHLGFHR